MAILKNHPWPGNIRELENVIEHAFVIEATDKVLPSSLPEALDKTRTAQHSAIPGIGILDDREEDPAATVSVSPGIVAVAAGLKGFRLNIEKLDFQANKEEFERQFLISALKMFKARTNQTALHANIPKKTLLRKLEKYGITARDYA